MELENLINQNQTINKQNQTEFGQSEDNSSFYHQFDDSLSLMAQQQQIDAQLYRDQQFFIRKNLKMVQKLKLPNYRSDLLFPASKELYLNIRDKQNLQQLINYQICHCNIKIQIKVVQQKYDAIRPMTQLFVHCQSCDRKMLMILSKINNQNDKFSLNFFDNRHIHKNSHAKSKLSERLRLKLVMKEVENFPKDANLSDLSRHIQKKFGLCEQQLRKILYRMKTLNSRNMQIKAVIDLIAKKGYKIWINFDVKVNPLSDSQIDNRQDPSTKQQPDFLMYSRQCMLQNYQRYGEVLYCTIIDDETVRGNRIVKDDHWTTIAFTGLNYQNSFLPFTIAYLKINLNTPENIAKIFEKFFKIGKKVPEVIISPQSKLVSDAILLLKQKKIFKGSHFYDGICYIQTISQKIEEIGVRKYFIKLITAKNKFEYDQQKHNLIKQVPPSKAVRNLLNQIDQIEHKLCYAKIQTRRFIGLLFYYSANKLMHNIYNHLFVKQKKQKKQWQKLQENYKIDNKLSYKNSPKYYPYTTLKREIEQLALFLLPLETPEITHLGYSKWKYQQYMELPQMQVVKENIQVSVLEMFMMEYGKIFEIETSQRHKECHDKSIKVFDVYDKRSKAIFVVAAVPEYSSENIFLKLKWRCNCLYYFKSGLPCSHEIKVAILNNSSFMDQIDHRWLRIKVLPDSFKKAGRPRGRPKSTRRNTEK